MSHDGGAVKRGLLQILLASRTPVDPARAAAVLQTSMEEVLAASRMLADSLPELGWHLHPGATISLTTTPEAAAVIARWRGDRHRLTDEALVTLRLLQRRGPMTAPEIARIRGVDDARDVLATLVEQGLVREAGRRGGRGRPFVYAATEKGVGLFRAIDDASPVNASPEAPT